MEIKVPRVIKVGSHSYKVYFDGREDDGDFRGSALHNHHEILLNPTLHREQLRVTFIHEVLHIIGQVFDERMPEESTIRTAEGLGILLFSNLGIDFDFSSIPTRRVSGR